MRVLNVNSSIDLKSGGGTAERTHQMSRSLALEGIKCTVLTLDIGLDAARIESMRPAAVVTLACFWRRFFVPRGGWLTISQLVKDVDVVHLMGHWSVLNALVYVAALRAGKPYAVCPAGALPLFGRSALLKRFYNFLVGNAIIRNASAWIAVTTSEFPHFESYGVASSKVTVISNGVNEVDFSTVGRPAFLARSSLPDAPFILFMGRLNPIKGPDLLLEAFAFVSDRVPDHQLVFAGPDGGMLAELRARAGQCGLSHRVHFLGHVDGEVKAGAYRFARMLVVPSRQEAMSIVALEAGICGTPVLLTDQCGFDEIAAVDPRLVVPATSESLAAGLLNLLENADDLEQIGPRTKAFVQAMYAWTTIITQYTELYRRLIHAGPSP
jgi:glycosyltransferase involved in cell wall biosynthesis